MRCALARIGGLSAPDKMPCHAWSTPAWKCKLGALLAKLSGTVCAACYALKGRYIMPNVKAAMERRYAILSRALVDVVEGYAFVDAFAEVLNARYTETRKRIQRGTKIRRDGRFFRWHDSGDIQSVRHLRLIVSIARATPNVQHWLPTREAGFVTTFLREGGVFPDNLTVRLSAPRIDHGASGALLALATQRGVALSGVHTEAPAPGFKACPAYTQGGHCLDCRACWDSVGSPAISYPQH